MIKTLIMIRKKISSSPKKQILINSFKKIKTKKY